MSFPLDKPVCDDYWDDMDATVVCRMLGFNSGIAFKGPAGGGPFGKVNLKTAGMYYFECNGPELSIFDCKHRTTYHCDLDEGAGVRCFI